MLLIKYGKDSFAFTRWKWVLMGEVVVVESVVLGVVTVADAVVVAVV